jgi:uncharacterized membrane protein YbhN (UPF0104 family)
MKTKLFAILRLAVTTLLFVCIFRKIDFHQFGSTLRNARLDILLIAFLVLWVGHYICIYRWQMLMRPLMPVLSIGKLFGIYCIGLFFNLTFPTVVGGDMVKMYESRVLRRIAFPLFLIQWMKTVKFCLSMVAAPMEASSMPSKKCKRSLHVPLMLLSQQFTRITPSSGEGSMALCVRGFYRMEKFAKSVEK